MKFLILFLIMFNINSVLAFELESIEQEICNSQADHVMDICEKYEGDVLKRCLVNEMEVQDFYLRKNFIIDSDLTVFCLPNIQFNNLDFSN